DLLQLQLHADRPALALGPRLPLGPRQVHGLADDPAQVHRLAALGVDWPPEGLDALDHRRALLRRLHDLAGEAVVLLGRARPRFHELRVADHAPEEVVEVVGDAGRHLPQGAQLLRLVDLLAESLGGALAGPAVRDVAADPVHAQSPAALDHPARGDLE